LTKQIKDIVGVSTEVTVGEPGAVPRSQGKAVRVVDNRGVA
jgi:phenylacetate-CoA ligase